MEDLAVVVDGLMISFYIIQPPRCLTTSVAAKDFLKNLIPIYKELKRRYEQRANWYLERSKQVKYNEHEKQMLELKAKLNVRVAGRLSGVIEYLEFIAKTLDEIDKLDKW